MQSMLNAGNEEAAMSKNSTLWVPKLKKGSGPLYLAIANAIAEDVATGHLQPEQRLPPQRKLAELLDLDNVVLTPHVAGWSPEAVQNSVDRFMENARRHLAGEAPVTPL